MELDKSPELGEGKAECLVLSSLLIWDTRVVQAIFVGQKAQGRAMGRIASQPDRARGAGPFQMKSSGYIFCAQLPGSLQTKGSSLHGTHPAASFRMWMKGEIRT